MKPMRFPQLLLAVVTMLGLGSAARGPIYNRQANAQQQIAAALAQASKDGKNVVLIFGANW